MREEETDTLLEADIDISDRQIEGWSDSFSLNVNCIKYIYMQMQFTKTSPIPQIRWRK